MSDHLHLLILGIAAVVVTAVLVVGTLAAADLLPARKRKPDVERARQDA